MEGAEYEEDQEYYRFHNLGFKSDVKVQRMSIEVKDNYSHLYMNI